MWIHAGVNGNELDQSIYTRTTTIQRHERNVTRRERDEENELESISIGFLAFPNFHAVVQPLSLPSLREAPLT